MLGRLGELCLYKMWTIYLQLVAGVNARPKDSSSLALCSLFFSAVSSPGFSFSYWNLLSIYAINLSPFSSTRVSHWFHVGHSQITSHNKDTFGMKAQTRTSHEMAWTHILFLSVGIDVMVKVSYFASRGSGYWAEVGRIISFITEHLCSLVFCSHEARWDSLEVCLAWICVCSTCEDFFHWCPCCLSHVLGHVQPFLPPYGSNVPVSGQSAFTSLVESAQSLCIASFCMAGCCFALSAPTLC